jgi:hypothetical protein
MVARILGECIRKALVGYDYYETEHETGESTGEST